MNSKALELAGVTKDTSDPRDGVIIREADGSPAGTLHEGAGNLVERIVPEDTPEDLIAGLGEAQRYLHSLGLTQWQEAIVSDDGEHAYRTLAARGELTGRVAGALWWERGPGRLADRPARRAARGRAHRPLPGTSVKIMQDGVARELHGARCSTPYLDRRGRPTDNTRHLLRRPRGAAAATSRRLDALGFQVHVHAHRRPGGARGARRVRGGPRRERRDRRRATTSPTSRSSTPTTSRASRELGVAANMQPLWACHEAQMDELTLPFLGEERAALAVPVRRSAGPGARLVAGQRLAGVARPTRCSRSTRGQPRLVRVARDGAALPARAAARPDDALAAYTAGSAYVNHLDDDTGTLEPGKLADLVVLDRDLFDRGAGRDRRRARGRDVRRGRRRV